MGGRGVIYRGQVLPSLKRYQSYLESQTLHEVNYKIFQGLQISLISPNWAIIADQTALYYIGQEIILITIELSIIMWNCIAFKDKEDETKENPMISH